MSLLFRSNNKNRKKLTKFQVGGTIPVYASFQYQPAPMPQFDPSVLLQRYAMPAAEEKSKTEKIPTLETTEGVGLDIDAKITNQEAYTLAERIRTNLATIPGYEKTEDYVKDLTTYEHLVAERNNKNKQIQELFVKNSDLLKDQNGQNSYYYKNGKYIAQSKDGELMQVTPEELRSGLFEGALSPITYGDIQKMRPYDQRLAGNVNVIVDMVDGMNYAYFRKNYLDPAFEHLGSEKSGWLNKGGGVLQNGRILESYISGKTTDDNTKSVDNAFKSFMTNMDPEAKNYLESRAHLQPVYDEKGNELKDEDGNIIFPRNQQELGLVMRRMLANEWMKRLDISVETSSGAVYDLEAEANIRQHGDVIPGTTTIKPGDPIADFANPDNFDFGYTEGFDKILGKTRMVQYFSAKAKNIVRTIDPNQTLSNQKLSTADKGQKFDLSTRIDEAFLVNGKKLNGIITENGDQSLLDVGYIDVTKGVNAVYVPIGPDGAVLSESKLKNPQQYKEKLKKLQGKYKGAELMKQENALLVNHLPEGGRVIQAYEATLVVDNRFFENNPFENMDLGEPSANVKESYYNAIPEATRKSFAGDLGTWRDWVGEVRTTKVLIPTDTKFNQVLASTNVFVPKANLSANSVAGGFNDQEREEEELYKNTQGALSTYTNLGLKNNMK